MSAAGSPSEALELHESVSFGLEEAEDGASLFDEKGRIPIHVIRPGIGKGKGRHLYEAKMLEEHAPLFSGWKMFVNHLSPEAKKAAGGLPRPLQDAGGIVKEAYWDPTVPADPDKGFGQGAVVGLAKPRRWVRELIEDDPALVEASISAQATAVRPVTRDGQRCWLVEGIKPKGSVDWVTEAGAGGRVAAKLNEAAVDEDEIRYALLESLDDADVEYLREARPDLLEAKPKEMGGDDDEPGDEAEDKADGGKDEYAEEVAEQMKKGLNRAMAEKAAKKKLSESAEEDDMPLTPEALQEAFRESPETLVTVLQESDAVQGYLDALVEAKVEEAKDGIKADAKSDVDRAFELARLEREAHTKIRESKLPETWQAGLREKYSLQENAPTEALDVVAETDDDGKVTKTSSDVLREALEADIASEAEKMRAVSPTRVRNQGVSTTEEGAETKLDPTKTGWGKFLRESANVDPAKAFALNGAGEDA